MPFHGHVVYSYFFATRLSSQKGRGGLGLHTCNPLAEAVPSLPTVGQIIPIPLSHSEHLCALTAASLGGAGRADGLLFA